MKRIILVAFAAAVVVAGCKKATTDEDEIRAILESDGLFNLDPVYGGTPDTAAMKTMGPQNWYRYIYPDSTIKTYDIRIVGDSAFVHARWIFKGQFRVITGYAGDSLTYVAKPLEDKAERDAVFRKIERRWRLVKISGVKFSPNGGGSAPFTIDSVKVIGSTSGVKVLRDPLTEFLDTSQIFYSAGENVEVRVYMSSLDTAYGYIHHWNGSHHRDAMITDTARGYMYRSYAITTRPGRYNVVADIITIPSFDTSTTEYMYEAWGFPYIVR